MKKSLLVLFLACIVLFAACSSAKNGENNSNKTTNIVEKEKKNTPKKVEIDDNTKDMTKVLFKTSMGDITIALYNETPLHRDNFIKLVNEKYYDGMLFHRIIKGFMIQTGDPQSRTAKAGVPLGNGGPGYTIPAEILPNFYHKRGAVAAARMGDQVNPKRESSGSQFYIVDGTTYSYGQMETMRTGNGQPFTQTQMAAYTSKGGAPFLDGAYTVFGEVVSGMEVVDKIAAQAKDQRDRPLTDIKIIEATIIKPESSATE